MSGYPVNLTYQDVRVSTITRNRNQYGNRRSRHHTDFVISWHTNLHKRLMNVVEKHLKAGGYVRYACRRGTDRMGTKGDYVTIKLTKDAPNDE